MQTIIENMLEKFKREIEKFFSQSETSIEQAEDYFVPRVSQVVTELMSAYYEQVDHALLKDRQGRQEAGLLVERKGDPKTLTTSMGDILFFKTLYTSKTERNEEGKMLECYLVDKVPADLLPEKRWDILPPCG